MNNMLTLNQLWNAACCLLWSSEALREHGSREN